MRNLVARKLFQGGEGLEGLNEGRSKMGYSGNIIADYVQQLREKEVEDTIEIECENCEGTGCEEFCYTCKGKLREYRWICPECNGTGKISIPESEAKENAEIRAGELKEDR